MLNTEKVIKKARTAVYEVSEGTDAIKLSERVEPGRLAKTRIINAASGAAAYLLILFVLFEGILAPYVGAYTDRAIVVLIIIAIVAAGVLFTMGYMFLAEQVMVRKYENVRTSLNRYLFHTGKLK